MPVETRYICDKCGKISATPEQIWEIGVSMRALGGAFQYKTEPRSKSLWCRPCVVSVLGFLPSQAGDPPAPVTPPTMQDILQQIIDESVTEQLQNRDHQ